MDHSIGDRTRFDTLFTEPRHYRSDCRLVRTAIRRGWLADAPHEARAALVARFEQATAARWEADPKQSNVRALLAECRVMLEMTVQNQKDRHRAIDILLTADRFGWESVRATGRPRERWHVSNYSGRIDANEIRRRAKAAGVDLRASHVVEVRGADAPDGSGERVGLAIADDPRYGLRVWLICPKCQQFCVHLFATMRGVICRKCGGIGYRDARG